MHIAIIGLGEVGRCYAKPLYEAGFELSLCEARPAKAAVELASSWGLPIHERPGEWLAPAQWVLSCVTGAQALLVVEQSVPYMNAGTSLADLTTASPNIKRRAAHYAAEQEIRYVDAAIMSAISLNWVRTPLLASGEGAEEFQALLEQVGGRAQVLQDGAAGDAISLKILRSVFTKGLEALIIETLMSAETQGLREKLYEQLSDIDQMPLRTLFDISARTHVIHAKRRAHEVYDAQQELATQGLTSLILPGVEQRFLATASALERRPFDIADPSVDQALQWLLSNATQA
ncbi:6-phosphogluconate dehydrogenase [Noviherbaspirillum sp. L7-7A]|uniref:NAD(P)-binding domain-containing protein n=1 Tax=Noviherbaspirillum sp. L7-7A TaxID=2850560 RepID=UPI001C2B8001|nr:NAD(P)-binding domain-containing protein [Noviherbaspirillum sp. L7-7A]MBV0881450.1 6-phosphogluconate dehydrogenase [Noviherbaspirillum sp. L7-7A]